MKALEKSKLLQSLMGFVSVIAVLWSGNFFINKIQPVDSPDVSAWEMAVAIVLPLLFGGFIIGLAIVSQKHRMSCLYYPVFAISFVSAISAYIMYYLESSVSALFWGLVFVPLGKPFMDITIGLEKLLEYTDLCYEKTSYMSQYYFFIVFLGVIVLSLIIYQYPTKKEKGKYVKWELEHSTKLMAKIMIGVFGIYAFLSDVLLAISYDSIVYDILGVILFPVVLVLVATFILYVVPLALCITLIIKGVKQAHTERNPRLILHPYIVAAVVSTIAGGVRLFNVAMLGF